MTQRRSPIDDKRRKIFLEVLAVTGSLRSAAATATPWAKGDKCGFEGFRALIRRDPELALDVEEAKGRALGKVEETIAKLATGEIQKPIYRNSGLVGMEPIYEPQLLLRLAERLDPEAWRPSSKTEISGRVDHAHAMPVISPSDVLLLGEEDQPVFVELLRRGRCSRCRGASSRRESTIPAPC